MKNIWKILPALAVVAVVITACVPEEKLDLAGYPETRVGINIADIKTPAPTLTLTALYNSEGTLDLDGELSHDYLIRLSEPNSQDMTLTLEPVCVNIPADKVVLTPSEFTLTAGEIDIPVTVTFTDADFNFAAPDKEARTYEIGVKIAGVKGYNTAGPGAEAKVVINKEAYAANLSLSGDRGRALSFKRAYWDGAILNADPMSYTFKAVLDKPAVSDVTVTFSMEGMPAAFADDWSVAPSQAVIPAGNLESPELTWTLTDDFLLTTTQGEKHELKLNAAFTCADPTVASTQDASAIAIQVEKVLDAMEVLTAKPAEWVKYPSAGWTVSHASLFNGSTYDNTAMPFTATIDMLEVKPLKGFVVRAYFDYGAYNCQQAEVYVSDDGVEWASIGMKENTGSHGQFILSLMGDMSTRYLKFDFSTTSPYGYISELEVY